MAKKLCKILARYGWRTALRWVWSDFHSLVNRDNPYQPNVLPATAVPLFVHRVRYSLGRWLGDHYLRLDYAKHDIKVRISGPEELRVRRQSCRHEPHTVDWLEGFPENSIVFLDIGANVGAYSLIAAKYHGQHGRDIRCFAVEPNFANYYSLCLNVRRNALGSSIVPMNAAISQVSYIAELKGPSGRRSDVAGQSDYQVSRPAVRVGHGSKANNMEQVIAFSLDDLVNLLNIIPTAIKIDVDGAELQILQGASSTLDNVACRTVLVEARDEQEMDVMQEFLYRYGFKLSQVAEGRNMIFFRTSFNAGDG